MGQKWPKFIVGQNRTSLNMPRVQKREWVECNGNSSAGNSENMHPELRVTVHVENCSGKDEGKVGLSKKSMHGTRDASNWERDWQGHLENRGHELGRSSRSQNKKKKTLGFDTRRRGSKGSLLELKKQLERVDPIKASIIGASSAKSIKALNRRIRWGETGTLHQHEPRTR